jgi:transcriptional regulator with XRE-family HTH domain
MRSIPQLTKLRAARLSRGLRLEDVAKEAGVSRTRASYVERDPSLANEAELDKLLGAIERLAATPAPIGSPAAQARIIEILDRLTELLTEVLADGEIDANGLATMLGIERAAVLELINHAVLTRGKSVARDRS